MLSLDEINKEIANIIEHGNTFEDCRNLSNLLICKYGLENNGLPTQHSVELKSGTEFALSINEKNINTVLAIIDELMSVLQAVNPNLYESAIRKIKEAVY